LCRDGRSSVAARGTFRHAEQDAAAEPPGRHEHPSDCRVAPPDVKMSRRRELGHYRLLVLVDPGFVLDAQALLGDAERGKGLG
jgi:hypothetical protein